MSTKTKGKRLTIYMLPDTRKKAEAQAKREHRSLSQQLSFLVESNEAKAKAA